jgi:hypothetical protein
MRHDKLWVASTSSTVEVAMHFVLKCRIKHYQPMIWHVQITESDETNIKAKVQQPPLCRSARPNAGMKRYDEAYDWNLMNLRIGAALKSFRVVTEEACKRELYQLLIEKKALAPVNWNALTEEQKKKVVSHTCFSRKNMKMTTLSRWRLDWLWMQNAEQDSIH